MDKRGKGRMEGGMYIAAADAGVGNADYYVCWGGDGGDGSVFVAGVVGAVEEARRVGHIGEGDGAHFCILWVMICLVCACACV